MQFTDNPQADFSALIAAFRSPSCVNCHAVAVTPLSTHPDIAWQAAPSHMDFRASNGQLKSDAELCEMARAGGEVITDPIEHLTEDPLILWAVTGGPRPLNSGNAPPAFGQGGVDSIPDWRQLIYDWAEAGMPCPSQ